MTTSNRVGWFSVLFLAVLALAMFFSAIARAEGSLVERLVAVQSTLSSSKEEAVDPRELAESIAAVPHVTREWAALILTIGAHESGLRARIARSEYHGVEGDGGRAFGLYQAHKNKLNESVWGSTDIRVQTLEAARGLRSAFYSCNARGKLRADWVARTINCYAGRRADAEWPGLSQRLVTFNRIVRRL